MRKKTVLEFDDIPALVFVQSANPSGWTVYQNGVKVKGVRSIDIHANFDDFTTHTIEYLTVATSEGER